VTTDNTYEEAEKRRKQQRKDGLDVSVKVTLGKKKEQTIARDETSTSSPSSSSDADVNMLREGFTRWA